MFGCNASGGVVAGPPPHPGYGRSGLRPGEGGGGGRCREDGGGVGGRVGREQPLRLREQIRK